MRHGIVGAHHSDLCWKQVQYFTHLARIKAFGKYTKRCPSDFGRIKWRRSCEIGIDMIQKVGRMPFVHRGI